MADNLDSVDAYIKDVRTLLQDVIPPFRYSDTSLLVAFNTALLEGRRLRPDLFVFHNHLRVPSYTGVSGELVPIEPQFRLAFVYGTSGHALMRDQEDTQDERSNMFVGAFQSILTGLKVPPIGGGTPGPKNPQA